MDASSSSAMLRALAPKVPLMLKTTLFHSIYLSPTSTKLDLRSEITVSVLRSMISGGGSTISKLQCATTKDHPVKGNMWISKTTLPAPAEDDLRQLLFNSIDQLKENDDMYFIPPETKPVEGEWTGHRAQATKDEPMPQISEKEKFDALMKETTNDLTVLYFHGGVYYLCDPATHRVSTSRLAKYSGGRIFSTRYRLAPRNPFPAGLLDALVAYLNLLYPSEGSFHEPIPASNIVFAGDSAGGGLALALMQALLQFKRNSGGSDPFVTFNGRKVSIPLPAGAALSSPWFDITLSMPSQEANARYDYLPPPSLARGHKECELWPADPPRAHIYCDGSALTHPLISPLRAKDWTGCPPVFMFMGEELLTDEGKFVAQTMAKQGVKVVFEQYEAMPHCFGLILASIEGTRRSFESWGSFCRKAVEDANAREKGATEQLKTEGWFISAKKLDRHVLDMTDLVPLTTEEVKNRTESAKASLIRKSEAMTKNSRL